MLRYSESAKEKQERTKMRASMPDKGRSRQELSASNSCYPAAYMKQTNGTVKLLQSTHGHNN